MQSPPVLAEGGTIPEGTTLWSLTSSTRGTAAGRGSPRCATGVGDPADEPALFFFVDEGAQLVGDELKRLNNRPSRLRATTLDGRQLWDLQFGLRPVVSHVAADNNGEVVLVFPLVTSTVLPSSLSNAAAKCVSVV